MYLYVTAYELFWGVYIYIYTDTHTLYTYTQIHAHTRSDVVYAYPWTLAYILQVARHTHTHTHTHTHAASCYHQLANGEVPAFAPRQRAPARHRNYRSRSLCNHHEALTAFGQDVKGSPSCRSHCGHHGSRNVCSRMASHPLRHLRASFLSPARLSGVPGQDSHGSVISHALASGATCMSEIQVAILIFYPIQSLGAHGHTWLLS